MCAGEFRVEHNQSRSPMVAYPVQPSRKSATHRLSDYAASHPLATSGIPLEISLSCHPEKPALYWPTETQALSSPPHPACVRLPALRRAAYVALLAAESLQVRGHEWGISPVDCQGPGQEKSLVSTGEGSRVVLSLPPIVSYINRAFAVFIRFPV